MFIVFLLQPSTHADLRIFWARRERRALFTQGCIDISFVVIINYIDESKLIMKDIGYITIWNSCH